MQGVSERAAQIDVTQALHTPHGWAVTCEGLALDPTWPHEGGSAHLGLPFADPGMWPHPLFGRSPLQEPPFLHEAVAEPMILGSGSRQTAAPGPDGELLRVPPRCCPDRMRPARSWTVPGTGRGPPAPDRTARRPDPLPGARYSIPSAVVQLA